MKDDAFEQKVEAIQAILDELDDGELTLEDGEQLLEDGLTLVEETRELLDVGSGKVVTVDVAGGDVVETPLRFDEN